MMTIPKTKKVDLTEFAIQAKKRVPGMDGMDERKTEIVIRRLSGDFTDAERTAILDEWNKHDYDVVKAQKDARLAYRKEWREKDPSLLTLPDRIKRLEIYLDLD